MWSYRVVKIDVLVTATVVLNEDLHDLYLHGWFVTIGEGKKVCFAAKLAR